MKSSARRRSVKEQIEGTPHVKEYEVVWSKKWGEELKAVPLVFADTRNGKRISGFREVDFPKSKYIVHQHPHTKGDPLRGLVTVFDLTSLSGLLREGKTDTGAIAVMNSEGKKVGHSVFSINKPLPEGSNSRFVNEFAYFCHPRGVKMDNLENYNIALRDYLKRYRIVFAYKFTAMPGYKYDKKQAAFVKKD